MDHTPMTDWFSSERHDVEQLMHDEFLDSLPDNVDRSALIGADRATYVLQQTVGYEYARPVQDLRQRLMIMPRERHGDQHRVAHRFDVHTLGDKRVRRRPDRFGNTVVHVRVPDVDQAIEFHTRAVLVRDRASIHPSPWNATRPTVTPLTAPDAAIREAAHSLGTVSDVLETADAIAEIVNTSIAYARGATTVRTTTFEA